MNRTRFSQIWIHVGNILKSSSNILKGNNSNLDANACYKRKQLKLKC